MNKKFLFLNLLIWLSNLYTMEKNDQEKEPTNYNTSIEKIESVKELYLTRYCEKCAEFYTLTTQIASPETAAHHQRKMENLMVLLNRYADSIERLQKVQEAELKILQYKTNLYQTQQK